MQSDGKSSRCLWQGEIKSFLSKAISIRNIESLKGKN
jgi:hypothetical protein